VGNHSLVCYPQPGKRKSQLVLEAFADGCGGSLVYQNSPGPLRQGPAAFFGCIGIEHLLTQARAEDRDWYYGDNSFFDAGRGSFFRFGRKELQLSRRAPPDHRRLKDLGARVQPWSRRGRHVLVVEQSEYHLRTTCGVEGWLFGVLQELRSATDRLIVVRHWDRDKRSRAATLQADLLDAHCVVTHTSAAANEAILSGVPAFVTGPCGATPVAAGPLSDIENPRRPEDREEWAAGLAGMQWTLDELRSGAAWRALEGLR
jgi:hypothetical protein